MKINDFKKRYGITQINPNLKLNSLKYVLVTMPDQYSYDEAMALLKREVLRPATLEDMCDWFDWDKEKQVVVCGSITEFEGRKFVPCICTSHFCEPKGIGFEAECYTVRRLAMLDISITWNKAGYLLGVREI